jgi:hypothetical protein
MITTVLWMVSKAFLLQRIFYVSNFVESLVLIDANSEITDLIYCSYLNNEKHITVCKHELRE